jgi:hypothetical protein
VNVTCFLHMLQWISSPNRYLSVNFIFCVLCGILEGPDGQIEAFHSQVV